MYKTLGFKWLFEVVLPRISFCNGRQGSRPQSPTYSKDKANFQQFFMLQICINQHKEFVGSQLRKLDILICF
jgi:hypothetical protein